jgi:hypothetical protein
VYAADSLKSEVRLPRDKGHFSYASNEQLLLLPQLAALRTCLQLLETTLFVSFVCQLCSRTEHAAAFFSCCLHQTRDYFCSPPPSLSLALQSLCLCLVSFCLFVFDLLVSRPAPVLPPHPRKTYRMASKLTSLTHFSLSNLEGGPCTT